MTNIKKIAAEMDERVKRVGEKGECYFLCGKTLKKQKKMLVGKTTSIHCCIDCEDKLWRAEFDNGWDECPEIPHYLEVDLTDPNWENKLESQQIEWTTRDLDTSDLYAEIERRKSFHKKKVKECWECHHKKTDDWFHDFGDNYQCRNCHNDLVAENKKRNEEEKKEKNKCSECGKTKLLGYRKNYFTEYCKDCWEFVKRRDRDCWEWCAEDCPFKKKNDPRIGSKQLCLSCKKTDYLEICDECQREFCMKCLGLYHGSEYLFCQSCFAKKSDEEKAIMRGEKKGEITLHQLKRRKNE